jgi:uncharacterized protein YkwD
MVHVKASHLLLVFVLAACALIALPDVSSAAAKRMRKAQCADTQVQPTRGNVGAVRAAVLCLHNSERASRGLPRLTEHAKLREAAARHSDHMVADRFFAHDSPGGAGMADRILRTGYAGSRGWSLGENIAWGTGDLATAAAIQRAWMQSPGHRANLLRRDFREIGIGIAIGAPVEQRGPNGATYTTDFGVRR